MAKSEGNPKGNAQPGAASETRPEPASRPIPWRFLGVVNLIACGLILLLGVRLFLLPRYFPGAAALIPLPSILWTPTLALPAPTQVSFELKPNSTLEKQDGEAPASQAGDAEVTITPASTLAVSSPSGATLPPPPDSATITPAPTLGVPLATPLNTPLPGESNAFIPQPGSPFYIRSVQAADNGDGCNSAGIAGQVFAQDGAPLQHVSVQVSGYLGEQKINASAKTGTALLYGPAGYEIQVNSAPLYSEKTLTVQLFDQQGEALSPKVYFNTYESCEKNLAIVNFIQSSK